MKKFKEKADHYYDFNQIFYGFLESITSSYSLLNKSSESDTSSNSDSDSDIHDFQSWEQLLIQGAEALKLTDKELKKSRFIKKLVSTYKIWVYSKKMKEIDKQKSIL